jgi:hypothetical protein
MLVVDNRQDAVMKDSVGDMSGDETLIALRTPGPNQDQLRSFGGIRFLRG